MAERRMLAKTIIDSDAFLSLSVDARLLYFSIGILARDKGLVNNIRAITRLHGISLSAITELDEAGYIYRTGDGEYTITHWYENNGIGETAKKRNSHTYRVWRENVLKKALYKCEQCGNAHNLQAHHVKPFAQYPTLRFDPQNGICLCAKCHRELHEMGNANGRC